MAMERLFTALGFCEAAMDGYGTSVLTTRSVNGLVSCGCGATKPAVTSKVEAEKLQGHSTAERGAVFQLAFDGLNCFDTIVMH